MGFKSMYTMDVTKCELKLLPTVPLVKVIPSVSPFSETIPETVPEHSNKDLSFSGYRYFITDSSYSMRSYTVVILFESYD